MSQQRIALKNVCLFVMIGYIAAAVLFWCVAKEQLHFRTSTSAMLSPLQTVGEITEDSMIEQDVSIDEDEVLSVAFQVATYARDYNQGVLRVDLMEDDTVLGSAYRDVSELQDNHIENFSFDSPIDVRGKHLKLRLTSNSKSGYGVTVMYGNAIDTIKGSVTHEIAQDQVAHVNGESIDGRLCFQVTTRSALWYGSYYGLFVLAIGIALAGYLLYMLWCERTNRMCAGIKLLSVAQRYWFLLQQLVSRDFKNKYKRSVLGVLWSFLNPLLTMLVQYFVFSNIFKSDTENFVVYLLTGIVFFNFFSESSNMAMSSIVGNSALITKVYVPKYIYPLSRVLSSGVNFMISLLPLAMVMLITRVQITPAIILIVYPIVCTFFFSLGIGLILASIMVFFRDTQFIYGVLLTALMYLTPIFYPISIIPERFQWLFQLNPICNNIVFARSCIIDGVFPGMHLAVLCGAFALVSMLAGVCIFKKTQDRFILNI